MTDTNTTLEVLRQLEPDTTGASGLGLNVDLMVLMAKMSREIKTQFPDGPMDSTAHVLQYEAVSSAVAAIRALLTSQPPDKQWRDVILRYALRAWSLTEGDPDKDETVRDAMTRAVADYRPPTPEQLKRSTEPAAKGAAKSSPAGKKGGES